MTLSTVPQRPEVEVGPNLQDALHNGDSQGIEIARTESRRRWPTSVELLLIVIAAILIGIGWVAGMISVPCNWCAGALRSGWDSARRLGGI